MLQVIDSIDRNGSFSSAAEELYRVPSAITYTVKKLEEQLDVKIFDRDKSRISLTPAGRLVLENGRNILNKVIALEEQIKRIEDGWETQLRIVVDTILPIDPLFPLLDELQKEHPRLDIQVMEEALSGSWEAMYNQRADLIIGANTDGVNMTEFERMPLTLMEMGLYCSVNHPAAKITHLKEQSQLENFCHVVVNDTARTLPQRTVGMLGLKQILYVPTMRHKYQAVINNLGISHLPRYMGEQGVKKGVLKELDLNQKQVSNTVYCIWKKRGNW